MAHKRNMSIFSENYLEKYFITNQRNGTIFKFQLQDNSIYIFYLSNMNFDIQMLKG